MKLCIVFDTAGTDGLVYELEPDCVLEEGDTADELGVRLIVKESIGSFPIPGAVLAAMMGIPDTAGPPGFPGAIAAPTRDASPYV